MEYNFVFKIGDKVTINVNQRVATVIGLFVDRQNRLQYEVEYSADTGAICSSGMFEDQITAVDQSAE
ncbi:MAG: hypothetical protein NTZ18_03795 [Candidatus Komeilibacteria bacterium]|nr:hypothetical protein [Candidatus Komeilibacteria bacterium]